MLILNIPRTLIIWSPYKQDLNFWEFSLLSHLLLSFHEMDLCLDLIACWLFIIFLLVQLTLRRVMDTAKQVTKSGELNEFSMVMLNNTLSLPLGIFLIIVFNEVDYLSQTWVIILLYLSKHKLILTVLQNILFY